MPDKTTEELAAEVERLKRDNQSLADRLKNAGGDLQRQLVETKAELVTLRGKVAAERGPDAGTEVCYQAPGEPFCRPASVKSDGFTERVTKPGGVDALHAHIEYGDPAWLTVDDRNGNPVHQKHTFEVDAAWSPLGAPRTWHCKDECPRLADKNAAKNCPYWPGAKDATEERVAKLQQQAQQAP